MNDAIYEPTGNAFQPDRYPLGDYVVSFELGDDWVTLRRKDYPAEGCYPTKDGRYHALGELAYYGGSGIKIACKEVGGDRDVLPDTHALYQIPQGNYSFFDVGRFVEDYPEAKPVVTGEDHTSAQALRGRLQTLGYSGVIFPSFHDQSARNVAMWPMDNTPFKQGTLKPCNPEHVAELLRRAEKPAQGDSGEG